MPSSFRPITIADTNITENTAIYGGGVYARSAFSSFSGNMYINNNKNSSGEHNNLYIASGVVLGDTSSKIFSPGSQSYTGISSATAPTSSSGVEICYWDVANHLFSDMSKYTIKYNSFSLKTYLVLK